MERYTMLLIIKERINNQRKPNLASQVALMVKDPPANAEDLRDTGSNPRLERFPGGGHGNPLQYSCLDNPMDGEAWCARV